VLKEPPENTMTLSVRYLSARTLDTTPAPSAPPSPGEVELAPAHVGICGTELHIFHGDMDARVRMPAVLGHEMPGRVMRVGPGVEVWAPGDAVTVMPLR
jgi:(R,R)-butanediol dehydrogenase/meso-butanediol dehydrogenase/diacetyl reductase